MNNFQESVLLIDNSNTRTKLLLVSDEICESGLVYIPTAELTTSTLRNAVQGMLFSRAVVSCVVPEKRQLFQEVLGEACYFLSAESPCGMDFEYEPLSSLGADRVANALAAAEYGCFPCVAVDAGTAITFDVVVQQGAKKVYKGGAIAPGLRAFTDYLHRCTARLPEVRAEVPGRVIAQNTVDALKSGAIYGFCGLVKEMIARIEHELGTTVHVLLTGGDAELIRHVSDADFEVDPLLTLRGLLSVARHI